MPRGEDENGCFRSWFASSSSSNFLFQPYCRKEGTDCSFSVSLPFQPLLALIVFSEATYTNVSDRQPDTGKNKGLCPVGDEREGSGNLCLRLIHFFQRREVYFGSLFCRVQPVIFVFTYWLDRASRRQE